MKMNQLSEVYMDDALNDDVIIPYHNNNEKKYQISGLLYWKTGYEDNVRYQRR